VHHDEDVVRVHFAAEPDVRFRTRERLLDRQRNVHGRARIARVQRDELRAQPRHRVQQRCELDPGRQGGRHAVALRHAERRQPPRRALRLGVQVAVGEGATARHERRPVGVGARPEGEPVVQRALS
jgi:hypothetical protein